ncbi:MAG: hypothetical protein GXY03_02080 [Solirubrobacterales bacterium]|nr:hypothetical protein [Solirubrobacterales bacterium]
MAQRGSRKRRKERQRRAAGRATAPAAPAEANGTPPPRNNQERMERLYARGRAKDEAARAKLVPLEPGERPTAVTVGAIVAAVAAVANLVALVLGFDGENTQRNVTTLIGLVLLVVVAYGMWRARYWAVLGMQTLLALTIVLAALSLLTAVTAWAAVLAVLLVAGAGTLFWFLIKAMARIQMPDRPGSTGRQASGRGS